MDKVTQTFDEIEAALNERQSAGEPIKVIVIDSIASPVIELIHNGGFKVGELAVVRGPTHSRGKFDMLQLWDPNKKARS